MVSVSLSLLSWHAPIPCSHLRAWHCPLYPWCLWALPSQRPPYQFFPLCRAKTTRSRKLAQTVRGFTLPTQTPTQLGTHGWPRAGPLGLPAVGPTPSPPCWVLMALGRAQLADAGWWLVLAGDIVDSSADSPPSLKARTHSVSTGGSALVAGGSHQSLGQGDSSPLAAANMGTGASRHCWAQAHGRNSSPTPTSAHPW